MLGHLNESDATHYQVKSVPHEVHVCILLSILCIFFSELEIMCFIFMSTSKNLTVANKEILFVFTVAKSKLFFKFCQCL